ncbi:substrate-binding domain-containing protein [Phytohabitans sp. LJ34]|uniref:substrate-binding domain-containing protein n=1 Tax=Phytohabitans sp. LJ34 TaxID=3452217 RepID=UPI003F8B91B8
MRGARRLRDRPVLTGAARVAHRTVPRGPAAQRAPALGLVAFDTSLAGPTSTVYAIARAARAAGHPLTAVSARSVDADSVASAVETLLCREVGGVLAVAPTDPALAALSRIPAEVPLVAVGAGEAEGVPVVGFDNVAGAASVTRHLLDLGHHTVHHVSGPPGWPEARERVAGWRAALGEAGAPIGMVLAGDWSVRSGYEAVRHLGGHRGVTAIFCANDQMALGALRALHLAGRAVPEEVSVVGFGDIPEAPFLRPPLTTVRQDLAALGRAGIDLLVRQIAEGRRIGHHPRIPPALVQRDSSARPLCER